MGNLLSIGLAPSADQCAPTLFRNSILVNAILNPMLSSESANFLGEKADVSQDCLSFLGCQLVLLSRAASVAITTHLPK